jgi:endonuclease-8
MPEGDTIFRAARTLHRALAGRVVTRFESVYPQLTRVDADTPVRGRTVERVEARGKHVVIWFSALASASPPNATTSTPLILRTHMRMHGSWHIYRPGERWQRPRHEMRIVIETDTMHAIAFGVPVAELVPADDLDRHPILSTLGPDLLSADFDAADAVQRLRARHDMSIADALLDQSALAGIGNVYKSEVLFAGRVNPFARVDTLSPDRVAQLVSIAVKLLRANVSEHAATAVGMRRTTGRDSPHARLWVYGRAGQPCRVCGTAIAKDAQGPFTRLTYWCRRCQSEPR